MPDDIFAEGSSTDPCWWNAAPRPQREPESLPRHRGLLVVGSGFTDHSAALTASRGRPEAIVPEAEDPGHGASTRNTDHVGRTLFHALEPLTAEAGPARAARLPGEAVRAAHCIVDLIAGERIEFGFAAARPDRAPARMKPLDHLGLSLWAATANSPPPTGPLEGERRADVVIVGAGYTGLSCAVHLAEAGREAVVLEARGIGHGGSGRNMGQVNPGVWADPRTVEKHLGEARGHLFNETFGRSFELVEELVNRFGIACGLTRSGNVYVAHSARAVRAVEERYRQLRAYGFDVEFLDREGTAALIGNECYHAALLDRRAGNVHPLNYALGLAEGAISLGAIVHTASPVRRLTRSGSTWRAETDTGSVVAERAVIATDSYSGDLWPGLGRTMVPIGVYAAATEPLGDNLRKAFLPRRTSTFETALVPTYAHMLASGRFMVGTLGHPPRWKNGPLDRWPRRQLERLFPEASGARFEFKWGGTIGMSDDHLPRLHEPAPGLTICCGFSGRGVTSATLGGKIVAERIRGTMKDEICPLPSRPIRPLPLRTAKAVAYELGFRVYRALAWLP